MKTKKVKKNKKLWNRPKLIILNVSKDTKTGGTNGSNDGTVGSWS